MDRDETHYHLLKLIEAQPQLTQREAAQALGVSLGKINYCLRALIAKGLVKAKSFSDNEDKLAYAYLLTPQGIEEKARTTTRFLRRKVREYELLRQEIENLRREVRCLPNGDTLVQE